MQAMKNTCANKIITKHRSSSVYENDTIRRVVWLNAPQLIGQRPRFASGPYLRWQKVRQLRSWNEIDYILATNLFDRADLPVHLAAIDMRNGNSRWMGRINRRWLPVNAYPSDHYRAASFNPVKLHHVKSCLRAFSVLLGSSSLAYFFT
jgi:hypothetical protein